MFKKMCQMGEYAVWGKLFLRLVVGIVFFVHGSQKLFGWFDGSGIEGATDFLATLGFAVPMLLAWVVGLVELVGGIFLAVGFMASVAALVLTIDMLAAFFVVHVSNGFFVQNGGVEMVLILLAVLISFALSENDKLSLDKYWCLKWRCRKGECLPVELKERQS